MHMLKKRNTTRTEIIDLLASNGVGTHREERNNILQDLSTSEIMIHVTASTLSFGHLRFQEFLASEELKNRRSFPTDKLLRDPWWLGPLMIYTQTAREVEWLFNHAIAHEYIVEVKDVLRSVAALRPRKEKKTLLNRLNIALADKRANHVRDTEFRDSGYFLDYDESYVHDADYDDDNSWATD